MFRENKRQKSLSFGLEDEDFEDVKVLMWMFVLDDKFWELGFLCFWACDVWLSRKCVKIRGRFRIL